MKSMALSSLYLRRKGLNHVYYLSYAPHLAHLFPSLSLPTFFLLSAPSMRLAYKDFEQQRKIEEQKLKGLEGKKKEQAERLGMGLGMRR